MITRKPVYRRNYHYGVFKVYRNGRVIHTTGFDTKKKLLALMDQYRGMELGICFDDPIGVVGNRVKEVEMV